MEEIAKTLKILTKLKYTFYSSGSQPFLAHGTLNMRKNLAAHLDQKFSEKGLEKVTNCQQNLFTVLKRVVKVRTKNLAAHLEGAHGTPVETH